MCEFNTSWESDNELEEDDPAYDEYWEEWYDVIKILVAGSNLNYAESPDGTRVPILLISYKHSPSKISLEDGTVIYQSAE